MKSTRQMTLLIFHHFPTVVLTSPHPHSTCLPVCEAHPSLLILTHLPLLPVPLRRLQQIISIGYKHLLPLLNISDGDDGGDDSKQRMIINNELRVWLETVISLVSQSCTIWISALKHSNLKENMRISRWYLRPGWNVNCSSWIVSWIKYFVAVPIPGIKIEILRRNSLTKVEADDCIWLQELLCKNSLSTIPPAWAGNLDKFWFIWIWCQCLVTSKILKQNCSWVNWSFFNFHQRQQNSMLIHQTARNNCCWTLNKCSILKFANKSSPESSISFINELSILILTPDPDKDKLTPPHWANHFHQLYQPQNLRLW